MITERRRGLILRSCLILINAQVVMAARVRRVLKADTNTNRVIGFSSSEYLTNGHPETTTTGFNLVPGT